MTFGGQLHFIVDLWLTVDPLPSERCFILLEPQHSMAVGPIIGDDSMVDHSAIPYDLPMTACLRVHDIPLVVELAGRVYYALACFCGILVPISSNLIRSLRYSCDTIGYGALMTSVRKCRYSGDELAMQNSLKLVSSDRLVQQPRDVPIQRNIIQQNLISQMSFWNRQYSYTVYHFMSISF